MNKSDFQSILIVEDEAMLAMSLQFLIGIGSHYRVAGIATDLDSSLRLADELSPALALIDIQLAHGSSGLTVASELHARGITCMFMTGNRPPEPRPDISVGCLSKPFSDRALFEALMVMSNVRLSGRRAEKPNASELELY